MAKTVLETLVDFIQDHGSDQAHVVVDLANKIVLEKQKTTRISKKARDKHIRNAGQNCPYCGVDISDMCGPAEYSDLEPVESGDVEQTAKCTKCGHRWVDVFRLVDVRELCD